MKNAGSVSKRRNGSRCAGRRWLGLLLSLCLTFSLCPMVQAATVAELTAQMNDLETQIASLENELERDYSDVVSVNGEIIRSNPLTVKVMKLFGYEYYVVQNPVADSTYMFGLYYNNCHKVTGSTVIYVDGVATNATVVGTGYPRAKEIKRQLNDLKRQLSDLDDQLYAAQLDEKYRPINERNNHLNSLKCVKDSGVKLIFKVGNPYLMICNAEGTAEKWNDKYRLRYQEVFPIDTGERDYGTCIEHGNLNAAPVIIDGSTMIPVRPLIEWLGGTVKWDGATGQIGCWLNGSSIVLTLGSNIAYADGVAKEMPVPVTVYNGKTVIPLRFVSENLGYPVDWIQEGQYVRVYERSADTAPSVTNDLAASTQGTVPDHSHVEKVLGTWYFVQDQYGMAWGSPPTLTITENSAEQCVDVTYEWDDYITFAYNGKLLMDEEGALYTDLMPVGDSSDRSFRMYLSYTWNEVGPGDWRYQYGGYEGLNVFTNYTGDKNEPYIIQECDREGGVG